MHISDVETTLAPLMWGPEVLYSFIQ